MALAALPRPVDLSARRTAFATNAVAAVALFLLGLNYPLPHGLSSGFIVVVVGAPVWASALQLYRAARPTLALATAALTSGILLAWWMSSTREIVRHNAVAAACAFVAAVGGIAIVLWARQTQSMRRIGFCYGAGLLITAIQQVPGSQNPWKYQLSVPITIIVLAVFIRARASVQALVLVGLAVVGIENDYRSYAAFCLLAALIVWWRGPRRPVGRPRPVVLTILLAGLAIGTYVAGTALLVNGYLGSGLQQRTVTQVQDSGSLLAGGRPEWAATWRLMQDHPAGYGLGAVPNGNDLAIGISGLRSLHVPTADGYAEHYMFAGQFRLHSVLADCWSNFGWVGVAWAVLITVTIAHALITRIATRVAPGLIVFMAILALWDIGFSPIYSTLTEVTFACSLVLVARCRT